MFAVVTMLVRDNSTIVSVQAFVVLSFLLVFGFALTPFFGGCSLY